MIRVPVGENTGSFLGGEMYEISKLFEWSASHILDGLPSGHQCGRLHGHNYQCRMVLRSPVLDHTGFVVDYGELRDVKSFIDNYLDHKHMAHTLVDSQRFGIPPAEMYVLGVQVSAENLAHHLWQKFKPLYPQLCRVEISETPKTWAAYWED